MPPIIQVAVGGALGALARFGVGQFMARWGTSGFPWATLCVNALGCFLMGLLATYFTQTGDRFAPLVLTGVLGGFTTYSAFSLDAMKLIEGGQASLGFFYIAATLTGALGGVFLGTMIARGLIT